MLQTQQILRDRYCLKRILGQNADRQTWLAGDLKTQKPVVVKLLTFSDRVQWDQVRLFEREAQVLQNLSHPQIPQYRDSFCLDDRLLMRANLTGLVNQSLALTPNRLNPPAKS